MTAHSYLHRIFRMLALVAVGIGMACVAHAMETTSCSADWKDGNGASRKLELVKQCIDFGKATEKCMSFHIAVSGLDARYADTHTNIQREGGYLVLKPYAIAEFSELDGGTSQQRLVINFIDNSGSPSRAEEGFQIVDASLRPVTTVLNMQEAGDELQRRGARVEELTLTCTTQTGQSSPPGASGTSSPSPAPSSTPESGTLTPKNASSPDSSLSQAMQKYGPWCFVKVFGAAALLIMGIAALFVLRSRKTRSWLAFAVSALGALCGTIVWMAASHIAPDKTHDSEWKISSSVEGSKINLPDLLSCEVNDFPFEWEAGAFHFDFKRKLFTTTRPPKVALGDKVWSEGADRLIRWIVEVDVGSDRKDTLAQSQTVRLTPLVEVRPNHFKVRMVASGAKGEVMCIGASDDAQPTELQESKALPKSKAAPNPSTTIVRPGGWICNRQVDAVQYSRMRRFGIAADHQGCMQVGAPLPVRILQRTQLAGTPVVNIGNAGGTAWTIEEDLQ